MLRVAFDGRSLASPVLRGWDRYAVGLLGELIRGGVEVTVFHRRRQPLHAPHLAGLGCRIAGLRDLGGLHYEQVVVPAALGSGRFDLFHAPFECGVPLASPCPVVLTLHSVTAHSYLDLVNRGLLPGTAGDYLGAEPDLRSFASRYWRAQVARARHILAPSEFCREEIIRLLGVAPRRVTTTPLAAHDQFRRPARDPARRAETLQRHGVGKPYLLNVGGYERHKNVRSTLEAFAKVRAARPDLALVIVGTKAVPDEVRTQVEALGLAPGRDVHFLVNLTEDLTDLYDEAELLVTLSWRETFGLPALEAMTRGVPVVASSWGAAPEVVGDAGRLVDPRDTDAARDAILELLTPAARGRLAPEIRRRAESYSWGRTAALTMAVYEQLAPPPSSPAAPGGGHRAPDSRR